MFEIILCEHFASAYDVLENGFFMGWIRFKDGFWYFDKHGKREASMKLAIEITKKIFSLNKEN